MENRGRRFGGIVVFGALAALVMPRAAPCAGFPAISNNLRTAFPVHAARVPSRLVTLGVDLWTAGSRLKALEYFRLAVGFFPTDCIAWHNFGVALYTAGRFEEALDAFMHERFVNSSAASALYGMGRCYMAMDKAAIAENAFVMALLIAPREWEYWLALSEALRSQGKATEAAAARRNADRLKPWPRRRPWSAARIRRAVLKLDFPGPDPVYRELALSRRATRLRLPPHSP